MPTVKEIKQSLKQKGCSGYSGMRKAELEAYLLTCVPKVKRKKNPRVKKNYSKSCPSGKEVSPKSGRCVNVCKSGQVRSKETGRCRKAKLKTPKRKSPKRKSPKRKSPKRKSPKRKSPKRKLPTKKSKKGKNQAKLIDVSKALLEEWSKQSRLWTSFDNYINDTAPYFLREFNARKGDLVFTGAPRNKNQRRYLFIYDKNRPKLLPDGIMGFQWDDLIELAPKNKKYDDVVQALSKYGPDTVINDILVDGASFGEKGPLSLLANNKIIKETSQYLDKIFE